MQRVKKRIFSGSVCEQEIYTIPDRANVKTASYKPRIKDDAEREQHKLGISRRRHRRLFNENFSPSSLYSTLTFDMKSEVHSSEECKYIRDIFIRKLKRKYPNAVIFAYYGMGKNTHRFHIHMVSEGVPEEFLREKWIYGDVTRIEHLRENCRYNGRDHGHDYTGLADYLFDHWLPEFGGHRWKMTKNARQPKAETPTKALRTYSEDKPPKAPRGYIYVDFKSNKYGLMIFKYVKIPPNMSPKKSE